jgi:hypothetical protein
MIEFLLKMPMLILSINKFFLLGILRNFFDLFHCLIIYLMFLINFLFKELNWLTLIFYYMKSNNFKKIRKKLKLKRPDSKFRLRRSMGLKKK